MTESCPLRLALVIFEGLAVPVLGIVPAFFLVVDRPVYLEIDIDVVELFSFASFSSVASCVVGSDKSLSHLHILSFMEQAKDIVVGESCPLSHESESFVGASSLNGSLSSFSFVAAAVTEKHESRMTELTAAEMIFFIVLPPL